MLVLLVVFPAMSYVYMKNGFEYQVKSRAELQDLGTAMSLPSNNYWGDSLVLDKTDKKVSLFAYFDPSDQENTAVSGKYFGEMVEQFKEIDWFRMNLLVPQNASNALTAYTQEKDIEKATNIIFYPAQQDRQAINQTLHIGADVLNAKNCVALADTNGIVVNYYDLADGKQYVRMMEHISLLRPLEEKKKAEALFRREPDL